MKVLAFLLLIAATSVFLNVAVATEGVNRFDNFKVYNVHIQDADQLKVFRQFVKKSPIYVLKDGVENKQPFHVALEPAQQKSFEKELQNSKVSFEVVNEDLQGILDQRNNPKERTFGNTTMNWTQYHDVDVINSWIKKIARENSFIKKHLVGFSAEGRKIWALQVSKKRHNKAIFIESSIHAIEWISSAVSTCFLNHLITTQSELLDKYDFIFLPVVNPDGLHYSHSVHPLWRKNRRFNGHFNESGPCYGVDLNRNFDSYWGQAGYNLDVACDHFYAGSKPETEPEVKAAIKFEKSFKKGYVRIHLAMHSYGQMLLLPYGHTKDIKPENYEQMLQISAAFATAAKARHGFDYIYGSSGQLLGSVSGASKDYWFDYGIKYSATLELRDRGRYGFFLPAEFIQPTCEEVTDGLYALINAAQEKGIFD